MVIFPILTPGNRSLKNVSPGEIDLDGSGGCERRDNEGDLMGGVKTRPSEHVLRELAQLPTRRVTVCLRQGLQLGRRLRFDPERSSACFYVDDKVVAAFAPEDVTVVSWLPAE